jgi:thiamine-monophosphate kinase
MRDSPEFERIAAFITAVGAVTPPELVLGPGDDAAIIRSPDGESLVVSTDLSIEEVHFRREWLTWETIGYRAVASAMSDLAAMAARPIGAAVSVALAPELGERVVTELGRGIGRCLKSVGAGLLGGDLSRSPGPAILDVVVVGSAAEPIGRDGALPDDELWITGSLGGAAAAASAWSSGLEPDPGARGCFETPRPRTAEALWLSQRAEIHAMIDLSDGLSADSQHLAAASRVGLEIRLERVPLHAVLHDWGNPESALALACGGGEDYELLIATRPGALEGLAGEMEREFEVGLTRIGRVVDAVGVIWLDGQDRARPAPGVGFDHFGQEA